MTALAAPAATGDLLFEGSEWDFKTLDRIYKAVEEIALADLQLDVYPNQVEVITAEQMLDAYASHGMPLMYQHWSFGKIFAREQTIYQKGWGGLAYEIVINSNPCIAYLMEENTAGMQALVMAHASFGHNHFFKNNYLFRQWTNAESILDYLAFAKKYVSACEEKYGHDAVEGILDSAHAIMDQGVFRYRRPPRPSATAVAERRRKRTQYDEASWRELWRTLPAKPAVEEPDDDDDDGDAAVRGAMKLPEENLIYFIEKHSPILRPWHREVLRIVRTLAQYFYPQRQTKVMNEGCATFVHHHIMNALYDQGRIPEGAVLEFLHSHSSVIFQPEFDDPRYYGINPYALGFAMMEDIKRVSTQPTEEDAFWFPHIAGRGDWREVLKDAWANFRDESFILQFLSPKVMRDFRLFALADKGDEPFYSVSAIHNEMGYRRVRAALARQYDLGNAEPNIQVRDANLRGDRKLTLVHKVHDGVPLSDATRDDVLKHVRRLWGHDIVLTTEKDE